MKYVNKAIIDLRRESSVRSERVLQALLGTQVRELQVKDEWCLIETPDGYEGFVENKHLSTFLSPTGKQWKVRETLVTVRSPSRNQVLTQVIFDTRFFAKTNEGRLILVLPTGEQGYIPQGTAVIAKSTYDLIALERIARSFVGTPYLWGGVSPLGFDCSGFVQRLLHYCFNEWLPRDTADQRYIGKPITVEELERGDLCFFPGHVALYLEDGLIIHSNRHYSAISINQLLKPTCIYEKELLRRFQGARRLPSRILSIRTKQ